MHISKGDIVPQKLISANIYRNDSSLKELIEIACDSKILLNYPLIINIILRYIFVFRYPELTDSKNIKLADIEGLIGIFLKHREIVMSGQKEVEIKETSLIQDFTFMRETRYQISMLVDVAATARLFMDIAGQKKHQKNSSLYLGLDLGTGSGILLLAQYIQARRNGFSKIANIGIEKDIIAHYPGTLHAQKISTILDFGTIIKGDTTNPATYSDFTNLNIDHISNETIPNEHVSMGGGREKRKNPDPFFENLSSLYSVLGDTISDQTSFFPQAMKIRISLGEHTMLREIDQKNKFGIPALGAMEQEIHNNPGIKLDAPEGWTIFDNVYPESILLNGEYIKLSEIGDVLYRNEDIFRNPNFRTRWKKILQKIR